MTTLWQWLVGLPGSVLGGVVLVGAFLSALGSFLVLARQSRISEGIPTQVEENLRRTEENLDQTREAVNRIEEPIAHITGGDSYCYFAPFLTGLTGPATNKLALNIVVRAPGKDRAKYALRDVIAEIYDIDKERQAGPPSSYEEIRSRGRSVPLGDLSPHFGRQVPNWDLGLGGAHRYSIQFFTNNGTFTQFLTIRVVDGMWAWASAMVIMATYAIRVPYP